MSQAGPSGHDGGLVDRHGVFCVVSDDGVARLVVGCDELVLLVYFCTPPLGAWRTRGKKREEFVEKEEDQSAIK